VSETPQTAPDLPGPEDLKIINLARAARARVASAEGAAVRDETGRTYAAAAVALPSLRLSALHLAVAMAVSSGASSLEAAALISAAGEPDPGDIAAVRELGPDAVVFHAGPDGTVLATLRPLGGSGGGIPALSPVLDCHERLGQPAEALEPYFAGREIRAHLGRRD
jgi:hypothetical protein